MEIGKYRLWDAENEVFFHLDLTNIRFSLENLSRFSGKQSPTLISRHVTTNAVTATPDFKYRGNCKNLVWQQCIGLKDKFGREIYVGDIVNWPRAGKDLEIFYYEDNRAFEMRTASDIYMIPCRDVIDDNEELDVLEIVGNIFNTQK